MQRAASGVIPTERMLGRHIFGSVRGEVLTGDGSVIILRLCLIINI
jgi:hypothetical protein